MNGESVTERQYIFFDLGWTLEDETDSRIDRAKKACIALKGFGIEATWREFLARQGEGGKEMKTGLFEYALATYGLSQRDVKEVSRCCPIDRSLSRLYGDAEQVLRALKRSHFLGIIADQPPGTEERLRRYGIRELFDLVFASAEVGLSKPDPRIFQMAQQAAGCPSASTWMVGDRIDKDIRPAKSLGWRTIRVLQGHNRFQEPTSHRDVADFAVERLSEIRNIFGSKR